MKKLLEIIVKKSNELVGFTFDTTNLQQRGVADKIEYFVNEKIGELHSDTIIVEDATSKKSIEDIQLVVNPYLIKIDTKSHDLNSAFSMPNLISIDKLRTFYKDDNHYLVYIFIDYITLNNVTTIKSVNVKLVEELSWDILAIQNLGKGQLQIKNMNNDLLCIPANRKEWMSTLKLNAYNYYEKLIEKVKKYQQSWV